MATQCVRNYSSTTQTHLPCYSTGQPPPPYYPSQPQRRSDTQPLLQRQPITQLNVRSRRNGISCLALCFISVGIVIILVLQSVIILQQPIIPSVPQEDYPSGAYWVDVTSNPECSAPGIRGYSGVLTNISEWNTIDACKAVLHREGISEPFSCRDEDIGTVGHWNANDSTCLPFWFPPRKEDTCTAYGKRKYTSTLAFIPLGLDAVQSCEQTTAHINGRDVLPYSCQPQKEAIMANWFVDWFEPDCVGECQCLPVWHPLSREPTCHSFGTRKYYSLLQVPSPLDPVDACERTAAAHIGRPTLCEYEASSNRVWGNWFLQEYEPDCVPLWGNIQLETCQAYGVGRYTATLHDIPRELDPIQTCYDAPARVLGKPLKPTACQASHDGTAVGTWDVQPNVLECTTHISFSDEGCLYDGIRRIEAQVSNIRDGDDWYQMCITTPLRRNGQIFLPQQCEERAMWFSTKHFAIYEVKDLGCVL